MSSYVAVAGIPSGDTCSIFGLTPQEIRYLQSKFPESMKHDIASWNPPHGIRLECTCTVVLNALGYIGFKVISTSGDKAEYLWTLERNLDVDTHFQAPEYEYEYKYRPTIHHSAGSLNKYECCSPSKSNAFHKDVHQDDGKNSMLKPPEKDKRRHSLGGKLAAAFHL